MREFEPAELGPLQRRNGVKSADKEIHYLVRGTFGDGEAEDDKGINDTRWVALDELLSSLSTKKTSKNYWTPTR